MPSEQTTTSCAPDIVTERNRYFTGKYMTARDFAGEQAYMLGRHQLHNRLLHGWGVVCGLRVVTHPTPGCEEGWVRVRSGIAIDCCGRELFLHHDQAVELPERPSPPPPPKAPDDVEQEKYEEEEPPQPEVDPLYGAKLLMLCYVEREIEHVPVLYNDGSCDADHQEANRVREEVAFKWVEWETVSPDCWKMTNGHAGSPCQKDCDDPQMGPAGSCLEPDCPCAGGVPLALITYKFKDEDGHAIDPPAFHIDMYGRRHLPLAPELLTHVVHVNWNHGGAMSLARLRELDGRLEVHFDRPLRTDEDKGEDEAEYATGVNEFTFEVQYRGVQRDYESLPGKITIEDERIAVFEIDPYYLGKQKGSRDNIAGNDVMITLKCDFILDCLGNPVDGEHLRGRLPSGNGTPGGTFMSWFHVTATDDYGRSENV